MIVETLPHELLYHICSLAMIDGGPSPNEMKRNFLGLNAADEIAYLDICSVGNL